jgi:hypothetical protein
MRDALVLVVTVDVTLGVNTCTVTWVVNSPPLRMATTVTTYVPGAVPGEVTIVNVELNFGFAIPPLGVKMAMLAGGTPLATSDTSDVELAMREMPNFANAPALTMLDGG